MSAPDRASSAGPDFVCFSIFDWWYHTHAHSDFELMRGVARGGRVLFVNSLGMRMPEPGRTPRVWRRIRRKALSVLRCLRRPDPALPCFFVFSPLSVPAHGSGPLARANRALVRLQIRLVRRVLGLRDPVWFVTLPTARGLLPADPRAFLVYNRSDKHSAFEEADQTLIRRLEAELLRRADLVLYVSHALFEAERGELGDRAHFLDHGVDRELFRPGLSVPADLARIPAPRLGFTGDLRGRVIDFDLLEHVALELPDAQLVLLGDPTSSVERLLRHPNVHWLGARPHGEVPAYLCGLDVGLLPYRLTDWVEHINPIKLKEYLAVGLPVVATSFPAASRADGVAVARDRDGFVALVRRALAERGRPRATPPAASWDDKVAELLAEIAARREGGELRRTAPR